MTSDNMKPMNDDLSDAQFDAFLQGRDGLAQLLRQMPQPTPSAALDAAILAAAAAAVAPVLASPPQPAANDPVLPGARRPQQVSWMARWRMPLGLAASLVLVLQVVWKQQSMVPIEAESVAIPKTKPLSAPPKDQPAEMTAGAISPAPQQEADKADNKANAQQRSETAAALPQKPLAKAVVRQDAAPDTMRPEMADKLAAQRADVSKAKMKMETKEDAARNQMAAAKKEAVEQPSINSYRFSQQAATQAPAPAPPLPAVVVAEAPATATVTATAPPILAAAPQAAAKRMAAPMDVHAQPDSAKAWILLIEGKLKAGLPDEALVEWDKFRKLYPSYPVAEGLIGQIKALQK